jgi:hypothetical protein
MTVHQRHIVLIVFMDNFKVILKDLDNGEAVNCWAINKKFFYIYKINIIDEDPSIIQDQHASG